MRCHCIQCQARSFPKEKRCRRCLFPIANCRRSTKLPFDHHIMAGGIVRHRALQRKSSHRRALLRNLVTSLLQHESISTTWPKAKEAQKLAEKMITYAKRNSDASRIQATKFLFVSPQEELVFIRILILAIEAARNTPQALRPSTRTV